MKSGFEIAAQLKRYEITRQNIADNDVVSHAWFRGAIEMLLWVRADPNEHIDAAVARERDELKSRLNAAQTRIAALEAELEWSLR